MALNIRVGPRPGSYMSECHRGRGSGPAPRPGFYPQLGRSPPRSDLPFLPSTTILPNGPADRPPDGTTTGHQARSSPGQTPRKHTGSPDDPFKTPDPPHALFSPDPIRSDPIRRPKIAILVKKL
ncbi:hypothetical protein PGTUg99_012155 [Puccinia graminis f. sp. tritici]|uniref:Uncharacterized protein n=1 Tax=Puccinia graminis f. sp. tritici TaxID=56615 RepID=A0A5B0QZ04_PUCGR|nr:hypothetical protein PGTUg99_012155 [Puccinia graminis f. sp. tritici]